MKTLTTFFLTLVVSAVAVSLPAMAAEDIFFSPPLKLEWGKATLEIPGADYTAVRWGNSAIPVAFNPDHHPWQEYGALKSGYEQLTSDEERREFSLHLFEEEIQRQVEMFNELRIGLSLRYVGRTDELCSAWYKDKVVICWDPAMDYVGRGTSFLHPFISMHTQEQGLVSMGGRARLRPDAFPAGNEWDVSLTLLHEVMHALGVPHLPDFDRLVFTIMGYSNMLSAILTGSASLERLDEVTLASLYPPAGPECAIPLVYQEDKANWHMQFGQVWSGSYQFSGEIESMGLPVSSPTPLEWFDPGTPVELRGTLSKVGFTLPRIALNDLLDVTPCGASLVEGEIEFLMEAALFGSIEPSVYRLRLKWDPSIQMLRIIGLSLFMEDEVEIE